MLTRNKLKQGKVPHLDPLERPTFALLGFNCTSDSDVLRMKALLRLYKVRITCASEQEAPVDQKPTSSPFQLHCDFKQTLFGAVDADAVIMMLDYFWLQGNWWSERYGENWLTPKGDCKVLEIFEKIPRLQVCIIPLDSSTGFMMNCATNDSTQRNFEENGLMLELIDWQQARTNHPLCQATEFVFHNQLNDIEKKSYFGQGRYVGVNVFSKENLNLEEQTNNSDTPFSFVVVFRNGLNWRSFIRSLKIKKRTKE